MPSCKYFINVELIAMLVAFAPMLLAVPVRNRILGGKPCQVEKHPYMVSKSTFTIVIICITHVILISGKMCLLLHSPFCGARLKLII